MRGQLCGRDRRASYDILTLRKRLRRLLDHVLARRRRRRLRRAHAHDAEFGSSPFAGGGDFTECDTSDEESISGLFCRRSNS